MKKNKPNYGLTPLRSPATGWQNVLYRLLLMVVFALSILLIGCRANNQISVKVREDLKSNDPNTRYKAVQDLSLYRSEVSVRLLIAALSDSNRGVRILAAETLGKFDAHEATPALVRALSDKDMWVRAKAAEALGEMNEQVAVEPLVDLLRITKSNTPSGPVSTESFGRDADAACFALKRLTGRDYGMDIQKWNAWLTTTKTNK